MKYLFLFLISLPALGRSLILEKHMASGYVPSEYSFVKDCKIYDDGTITVVSEYGNGHEDGFSKVLKKWVVRKIKSLNRLAQRSSIEEGPVLCDAGTEIVTGYVGTKQVLLLSAPDCDVRRENQGRAAHHLRKLAQRLCDL